MKETCREDMFSSGDGQQHLLTSSSCIHLTSPGQIRRQGDQRIAYCFILQKTGLSKKKPLSGEGWLSSCTYMEQCIVLKHLFPFSFKWQVQLLSIRTCFGASYIPCSILKTLLCFRSYKIGVHKQILRITIRFSKLCIQHKLY